MAVVADVGELAALVTVPWDVSPFLYPESLRTTLRKFIWHLRDALEHSDVTSQAMAALVTTPGATWDDVTAVGRAWQESSFLVWDNSMWLMNEAMDLLRTWEDGDTSEATTQAGDLQDEIVTWRRVKNILVDRTHQPWMVREVASFLNAHKARVVEVVKAMVTLSQLGVATKRGQWAEATWALGGVLGGSVFQSLQVPQYAGEHQIDPEGKGGIC
ncbi:hypothetical protein HGM15179_018626 [Zosterops borbonicus]|uniref:Uncharacterized protein n=1 Tax=Zosterops borbonicus TaxID=364589 RepID=A0A8K1DA73_9PASS|nr:hypothetical protein HGM15179_018626 [Zosterops borbonicus]